MRKHFQPTVATKVTVEFSYSVMKYYPNNDEELYRGSHIVETCNPIRTIREEREKLENEHGQLDSFMYMFL